MDIETLITKAVIVKKREKGLNSIPTINLEDSDDDDTANLKTTTNCNKTTNWEPTANNYKFTNSNSTHLKTTTDCNKTVFLNNAKELIKSTILNKTKTLDKTAALNKTQFNNYPGCNYYNTLNKVVSLKTSTNSNKSISLLKTSNLNKTANSNKITNLSKTANLNKTTNSNKRLQKTPTFKKLASMKKTQILRKLKPKANKTIQVADKVVNIGRDPSFLFVALKDNSETQLISSLYRQINKLESTIVEMRRQEENEDAAFVRGLLERVKDIPEAAKDQFKMKVQQVVEEFTMGEDSLLIIKEERDPLADEMKMECSEYSIA